MFQKMVNVKKNLVASWLNAINCIRFFSTRREPFQLQHHRINLDQKKVRQGKDILQFDIESPFGQIKKSEQLRFPLTWLRHQCRCSSCFNHDTFQSKLKLSKQLLNIQPIQVQYNSNEISCFWEDNHETNFEVNWLKEKSQWFSKSSQNLEQKMQREFKPASVDGEFNGNFLETAIEYDEFMTNDESGVVKLLQNVVTNGFGVVKNSPANVESTVKVVERVSHMQNTMFGYGACVISSKQVLEHKDTAYTSEELDVHTDTTYFNEPMGLEIFHCLKHDGQGGQSSLTDGFLAAQILYETKPEAYQILATTPVLFEYFDNGKHYYASIDVVLGHNKFSGILERVKFNMSDMRSPIHIPIEGVTQFYTSLLEYYDILKSTTEWIKLSPGTILLFDNWRLLHGRSSFTGSRVFATIYVGRSDWLSKARLLGVIKN